MVWKNKASPRPFQSCDRIPTGGRGSREIIILPWRSFLDTPLFGPLEYMYPTRRISHESIGATGCAEEEFRSRQIDTLISRNRKVAVHYHRMSVL